MSSVEVIAPLETGQLREGLSSRLRRPEERRALLTYAALFVVCLGAVASLASELSQPHWLFGVTEYDDGVYLASAIELLHGFLPYRDFVFVQPPGASLVLTPAAATSLVLGSRDAMVLARLLTAAVEVANVTIVAWLVRRYGPVAVLVAGGILVAFPASLYGSHTVLLEPYLDLFCLLGLVAAFPRGELGGRRRLGVAGIAFGLAGAVKLWAIAPFVVLVAIVVVWDRRRAVVLLAGAAGAFGATVLPFALAAPRRFVRDVFIAQADRRLPFRTPLVARLRGLTGLEYQPAHAPLALTLAACAVFALVVVAGARLGAPARTPLGLYAPLAAVAVGLLLLVPSEYYYHYGAFEGPFLALSLGLAAGSLAGRSVLSARVVGTLAVAVVALLGLSTARLVSVLAATHHFHDPGALLSRLAAPGSCAIGTGPGELVVSNRLSTNLARCPQPVDPGGVLLADGAGRSARKARRLDAALWQHALEHAQYVVGVNGRGRARIDWTRRLVRYLHRHFVEVRPGLYARRPGGLRVPVASPPSRLAAPS